MFKLVISDDEGKNTVVPLVRDEVTIGRKDGNTIRLTERNVSRRHARLRRVDGGITIEDLSSYNGVRVNGKRIKGDVKLEAGDQIVIGDYLLALQIEGADTAASPDIDLKTAPTSIAPAPPPPAPARLVLLYPQPGGAEFALSKTKTRIGRAEQVDVVIQHRSISREHAEITRNGNEITVSDLGSANGVRVNGRDVQTANIKSLDIIELGQVRLTYIAEGEEFIYDPAMAERGNDAADGPSRTAQIVGALVVLIGAVAAYMLFTRLSTPSEPTTQHVAGAQPAAVVVQPAVQAVPPPQDPDGATFARGLAALASGDLERAYFELDSLPASSTYRSRPEIADVTVRYARVLLSQAEAAAGNVAEKQRLAGVVLAMSGLPNDLVTRAHALEAPPTVVAAVEPSRPRTPVNNVALAATEREPTRTTPTNVAAASTSEGALTRARDCARRGDNACVLRELEGHARSEAELVLLIETLRATQGRERDARRYMSTFVRRFPSSPRTRVYQSLLSPAPSLEPNPF